MDRVDGKESGGQRRQPERSQRLPHHPPDEHGHEHVHDHIGQVIAERVVLPYPMIEREARHRDGPVQQNLFLVGCLGPVIRNKQARNVGDAANEGIVEHQGLVIKQEGAVERIRVQREGERPTEEAGEERCLQRCGP